MHVCCLTEVCISQASLQGSMVWSLFLLGFPGCVDLQPRTAHPQYEGERAAKVLLVTDHD